MGVVESSTARDEARPGLCQAASHSSHCSGTWFSLSENSAAVGQLPHVNKWPGKTLAVSGEWNGQHWRGELRIDKIVNGIVQGTITGEVGGQKVTGRLKTDVQILALP